MLDDDQLSGREMDVIHLIAQGLSNQGITRRLNLSVKSVEAIIRSIFRKLDLTDDGDQNRRVRATLWYRSMVEQRDGPGALNQPLELDSAELAELVTTKPFDTIVSVLGQQAVTAGSVAWSLLAAAAWYAAIVEDFALADELAERAHSDTQPGSPQGIIVDNLRGVLATFVGRAPWDHGRLDRLESLAHRPLTDPGRQAFDSVEPVLEIANWFTFADRPSAAAGVLDRRIDAFDERAVPDDPMRDLALCCRAELDIRRGRWDRAEAALRPVLARAAETSVGVGYASVLAARIAAARGKVSLAESHLRRSRAMAIERGDRSTVWRADAVEGFALLVEGDPEGAASVLQPMMDRAIRSRLRLPSVRNWEVDLVEAQVLRGDRDGAVATTEWLVHDVQATGSRWGDAALCRARGLIADSDPQAIALFDQSATLFRDLDGLFEAARSDHMSGLACNRAGRRVDALTRLRRAATVFDSLQAVPFSAAVAHVLHTPT